MVLYVIGLGLGDEKDVTVRGLEAIKSSDKIFLECYTSILSVDKTKLEEFYGKEIIIADRDFVIATVAAPTVMKEPEKPAEAEAAEGEEGTEGLEAATADGDKSATDVPKGDKKESDDKKPAEKKPAEEKK